MAQFPIPHTDEWFEALGKVNPDQAEMTKIVLERAGRIDVCSVCGDRPASDYEVVGRELAADAVATIRLCGDCVTIRRNQLGEKLAPFDDKT